MPDIHGTLKKNPITITIKQYTQRFNEFSKQKNFGVNGIPLYRSFYDKPKISAKITKKSYIGKKSKRIVEYLTYLKIK